MVCPGEAQNPFEVWLSGVLPSEKLRVAGFFFFFLCRWCLDTALLRPVTALDNERFTVQSVMLHYAVPVVLVCEGLQGGERARHGLAAGPAQARGHGRVRVSRQCD